MDWLGLGNTTANLIVGSSPDALRAMTPEEMAERERKMWERARPAGFSAHVARAMQNSVPPYRSGVTLAEWDAARSRFAARRPA